jgi:hypothetical protein
MITETVGERRVDMLDGRDLRRWHTEWSAPLEQGGKPRLAAARMALIVLKTALTFCATCRKPGCAELRDILRNMRFAGPRPRIEAPTAAEVIAVITAAHELGHSCARVCAAIRGSDAAVGCDRQMDTTVRQKGFADYRRQ